MASKLPLSFYRRDDVTLIARELLGKVLCTNFDGVLTSGIIVETEAYSQREKACHAFGGKRTPRTEVFYNDGGLSYVYLCYGIHYLFNIITNAADTADAVLVRAIEPVDGVETMLRRRKMNKMEYRIGAGPGSVSQALGLNKHHNALDLTEDHVWLERRGIRVPEDQIIASPRVGVDYAGDDALLPWRYRIAGSLWVSKAK